MEQRTGESLREFRDRQIAEKQAAWNARSERYAKQVNATQNLIDIKWAEKIENGCQKL